MDLRAASIIRLSLVDNIRMLSILANVHEILKAKCLKHCIREMAIQIRST